MVLFKDISYMLSHAFFMAFIYLFLRHRYSRWVTLGICFGAFTVMNLLDYLKLNLYPDSSLCYFLADIVQIFVAQSTGLFISRKRDSRVLFVGLSASNYVIVGSITASILYLYTENLYLALGGNLLMHMMILLVLYFRLGDIFHRFYEWDFGKEWWELCLIPVFFFCSFSCIAFFPHTLYEYPENVLVSIFLMITMLVSYVVVLRYVDSEVRRTEGYWKNIIFESYIKGLESQHDLAERSERNLKILRHDMRHYSMIIDSLLDQGEYDEIRNVVRHINEVSDENKVVRYCENLVLNTILLKMAEPAQAFGIDMQLDIAIPRRIPINEYELALVLANLLENAVFSVKELEPARRYIKGKIHCTEEHLLIDMENECGKEVEFDEFTGLPKSSRGENHGLGMQSIQVFLDKAGGTIDCYCEENRFRIILFANLH